MITNLPETCKLGPGLARNYDDKVVCNDTGVLKHQAGFAWVETAKKRYIPVKGELKTLFKFRVLPH